MAFPQFAEGYSLPGKVPQFRAEKPVLLPVFLVLGMLYSPVHFYCKYNKILTGQRWQIEIFTIFAP